MRVGGAAAPNVLVVFTRRNEGRHRIHVGREDDFGVAPGGVDVVAAFGDGHFFDLAVVFFGKRAHVFIEIVTYRAFVRRDRIDVDQRPREFENVHGERRGPGVGWLRQLGKSDQRVGWNERCPRKHL